MFFKNKMVILLNDWTEYCLMKFDIVSEKCILKSDKRLWGLDKKIDIYNYLNPINSEEEKNKFLKEYESGNYYNPQFKYEIFDKNIELLYNELLLIRNQLHKCKTSLFAPYYPSSPL